MGVQYTHGITYVLSHHFPKQSISYFSKRFCPLVQKLQNNQPTKYPRLNLLFPLPCFALLLLSDYFDVFRFLKTDSTGRCSKFQLKTAFLVRIRRFTPEKEAKWMIMPWNDLLYLLKPFQANFAFLADRTRNSGQNTHLY